MLSNTSKDYKESIKDAMMLENAGTEAAASQIIVKYKNPETATQVLQRLETQATTRVSERSFSQEVQKSASGLGEIESNADKAASDAAYNSADETPVNKGIGNEAAAKELNPEIMPALRFQVTEKLDSLGMEVITVNESPYFTLEDAIELMNQDDNVEYAQPDYVFEHLSIETGSTAVGKMPTTVSDPDFGL